MAYPRERAQRDRSLQFEEIVSFLNKIENNVPESCLQAPAAMPRGGNVLERLQTGSATLNTFQSLGSNTDLDAFVGSFSTFHRGNQREENFIRGDQQETLIIMDVVRRQ